MVATHLSAVVAVAAMTLLSVALLPYTASAAYCNMKSNVTGVPNLIPIDLSEPVFVRRVPNGELYTVGSGDDIVSLVHLYGTTGYENGYAIGMLLGEQVQATLPGAYNYFKSQVEQAIAGALNQYNLPQTVLDAVATIGLDALLDIQNAEAAPYMQQHWYDEMQGLSDASGVDYKLIRRLHMFGELTQGDCSFYGIWGDATAGGKTLQLRALDWDTHAGLQNAPTITIYHAASPTLGGSFANVGWAGWLGTLTGMNEHNIGISEIGISYPDNTWGNESYIGIPFIYLERLILERAHSYLDAEALIMNATRTCRLVLGFADGNAGTARLTQYSHSIVRFFNDTDLEPLAPWHPRIPNTVYCGMDWVCPYYQHLLATQLTAMHGRMTPELSISNLTSVVQTGDLHAAVYDLTESRLFVANARRTNATAGSRYAYGRQWVHVNLSSQWKKPYGQN